MPFPKPVCFSSNLQWMVFKPKKDPLGGSKVCCTWSSHRFSSRNFHFQRSSHPTIGFGHRMPGGSMSTAGYPSNSPIYQGHIYLQVPSRIPPRIRASKKLWINLMFQIAQLPAFWGTVCTYISRHPQTSMWIRSTETNAHNNWAFDLYVLVKQPSVPPVVPWYSAEYLEWSHLQHRDGERGALHAKMAYLFSEGRLLEMNVSLRTPFF